MNTLALNGNARYEQIRTRARLAGLWKDARLYHQLVEAAALCPDKIALVDPEEESCSYDELLAQVHAFAVSLAAAGLGAGDCVALQMPNGVHFATALLASNKLGATVAVVDPAYKGVDLDHILTVSRPKLAIVPAVHRGFDYAGLYGHLRSRHPDMSVLISPDCFAAPPAPADATCTFPSDNLAVLCFSSGTESVPKAVAHTDGTWMAGGMNVVKHVGLDAGDVLFAAAPFSHSIGLLELYVSILLRATLVVQDKWDGAVAYRRILARSCTFAWGPPTFLRDVASEAAAAGSPPSSLRAFLCGGANISPQLRASAEAGLGCTVNAFYGSTEVLGVTMTSPCDPQDLRLGTEGRAISGFELQVWGDDGAPQPPGVAGEVVSRGPSDFLGYLGSPDLDARYISPDGWYRSGDLGTLDERGYLRLVGRKKDIVIRGGLNINVRQVEELLEQHPDLLESAIVGLPDERLGERCCLCAVPKPDAALSLAAISDFLQTRGIDKLKVPEYLVLLDRLPKTPSGKIAKQTLRDQVVDSGGIVES